MQGVDGVGFDGDFWTVFGSEFPAFDDVSFRAISSDDCECIVLMQHLEGKSSDEKVEALFHPVEENLWNEACHHIWNLYGVVAADEFAGDVLRGGWLY